MTTKEIVYGEEAEVTEEDHLLSPARFPSLSKCSREVTLNSPA